MADIVAVYPVPQQAFGTFFWLFENDSAKPDKSAVKLLTQQKEG